MTHYWWQVSHVIWNLKKKKETFFFGLFKYVFLTNDITMSPYLLKSTPGQFEIPLIWALKLILNFEERIDQIPREFRRFGLQVICLWCHRKLKIRERCFGKESSMANTTMEENLRHIVSWDNLRMTFWTFSMTICPSSSSIGHEVLHEGHHIGNILRGHGQVRWFYLQ